MRVRNAIARSEANSHRVGLMPDDLDYLCAGLHGRRSRMAEGERLASLCQARVFSELAEAVTSGSEPGNVREFQRLLTNDLVHDLSGITARLSGPGGHLVRWLLIRFLAENFKVLVRTRLSGRLEKDGHDYLIPLPGDLALDVEGLSTARSIDDFTSRAPKGWLRESVEEAVARFGKDPPPFFAEATLDHAYFRELLARVENLAEQDREMARPLFVQEVDIFHLMTILRGRFHYGIAPEDVLRFHVPGTRISRRLYEEMAGDQNARQAVERVTAKVFEISSIGGEPIPLKDSPSSGGSVDASFLEGLAWRRFACLAHNAFRQSHMGLGAVLGYLCLRRIEVANLFTVSEGIRKGVAARTIDARTVRFWDGGLPNV
jgi:vacuolar-type H+-ATPase subunit C/Vma6